MGTQEVKIIGQYDDTTGLLSFPATEVQLEDDGEGPPPEPPSEAPLPPANLSLTLTSTDQVVIKCDARPGEKYKVWKSDEPNEDFWPIGETSSGEYRDTDVQRGNDAYTLEYTMTTVRLVDSWESVGADAKSIEIPAVPETEEPPPVEPPVDPENPVPPQGGQIPIIEMKVGTSDVTLRFVPFPGARDHWIYPKGHPSDRKAVGFNGDVAQWTGAIPGGILTLEALDIPAPYQPHVASHHHPPVSGGLHVINGQGPRNNIPKVIARSVDIPVKYKGNPSVPSGGVFLHYDTDPGFKRVDDGDTKLEVTQADGKVRFFGNQVNVPWTDVFQGAQHLMFDISDGPSTTYPADAPLHAVKHQSNCGICMDILQGFNISGGKYLRVYTEWDGRLDEKLRRWVKINFKPANEKVYWIGNIDEDYLGHENLKHTDTNNFLVWRFDGQAHTVKKVTPRNPGAPTPKKVSEWSHWAWDRGGTDRGGPPDRQRVYKDNRKLNGINDSSIDCRHGFLAYIGQNHQVFYEIDPLGYAVKVLEFRNDLAMGNDISCFMSFHVYHTDLGRNELKGSNYFHWQDNTPYNHVFHGDQTQLWTVTSLPTTVKEMLLWK